MKQENKPKIEKAESQGLTGWNNPTKRPEVRKKLSEYAQKQWQKPEYRKLMSEILKGNRHPSWKGGKHKTEKGYIKVNIGGGKRKFEHRLIMEKFLERPLEKWEWIHHKNGIKDDNRIENLEIVISKNHQGYVRCPFCLKFFSTK